MPLLEPRETYNKYLTGKIDKSSIISYYISLIEKSNKDWLRIDALRFLNKLGLKSDFYFKLLEYLLLSDEDFVIKAYATKFLIKSFPYRAVRPIQWALENLDWNSLNDYPKIGLGSILRDLRNSKNPKLIPLLNLKEHVAFDNEIFLVKNHILILNNLGITSIKEIEGLEKLANLHELHLSGNEISEIKGLENLTKLKLLDLSYNKIKQIKHLDSLLDLNQLYLNNNEINQISGLDNLINLHFLNLDSNEITEIDGLNHNKNLHTLYLSHNNITEIENLTSLTNLFILALNNNKIKHINGLENLYNLRVLRLNDNQLTEIKGFNNLNNLITLNLANNKIKRIPRSNLPRLTCFNIDNNQIPEENLIFFYKNNGIFKYLHCF
ncbi:MAG: leucine-rich repeat domain-containing protein [Promethearchaeota archaeon]